MKTFDKKTTLKDIEKYLSDQADLWSKISQHRPITPEEYWKARGKFFAFTDAWWQVKEFLDDQKETNKNNTRRKIRNQFIKNIKRKQKRT